MTTTKLYRDLYGVIPGFCEGCGRAVDLGTPLCKPCRGEDEKVRVSFQPQREVRPEKLQRSKKELKREFKKKRKEREE